MPSRDYLQSNTANSAISPESLVDAINNSRQIVILDCRPQAEFARSHIRGAFNLTMPASVIMLRRLENGKLNISSLIKDQESREKFEKIWKDYMLILYDADTDFKKCISAVLSTLLKRLQHEKCSATFLQGGFNQFQSAYPEWCEAESVDSPALGLEALHISAPPDGERCDSGLGYTPCERSEAIAFPIEILPHLFLGNASNSCDLESLVKHGIHYVLNVTPNLPNAFERKEHDIKYMKIPIQDHWSQNLSSFFPEAIAFIDEARQKKLGVLVHCLAGISRSVTITLAYIMHELGVPLNDAYDFVRQRKANIAPNFSFLGQLKDFESQLNLNPRQCRCQAVPCCCDSLRVPSPSRTTPDSGILVERWT